MHLIAKTLRLDHVKILSYLSYPAFTLFNDPQIQTTDFLHACREVAEAWSTTWG